MRTAESISSSLLVLTNSAFYQLISRLPAMLFHIIASSSCMLFLLAQWGLFSKNVFRSLVGYETCGSGNDDFGIQESHVRHLSSENYTGSFLARMSVDDTSTHYCHREIAEFGIIGFSGTGFDFNLKMGAFQFIPIWFGLSSSQVILHTPSDEGFDIEYFYGVQYLNGHHVHFGLTGIRNLPFSRSCIMELQGKRKETEIADGMKPLQITCPHPTCEPCLDELHEYNGHSNFPIDIIMIVFFIVFMIYQISYWMSTRISRVPGLSSRVRMMSWADMRVSQSTSEELIVGIWKEKKTRRRRRRRRRDPGGLLGLAEVSSSHSGCSTPSSPLSPSVRETLIQSEAAPYSRAPGSKPVSPWSKEDNKYTYDIWGDHFSEIGLMGQPDDVECGSSFFLRGPQAFVPL